MPTPLSTQRGDKTTGQQAPAAARPVQIRQPTKDAAAGAGGPFGAVPLSQAGGWGSGGKNPLVAAVRTGGKPAMLPTPLPIPGMKTAGVFDVGGAFGRLEDIFRAAVRRRGMAQPQRQSEIRALLNEPTVVRGAAPAPTPSVKSTAADWNFEP